MTATEARIHFGELLRAVTERGEVVLVERAGQPQAAVLSIGEYRRLQEDQSRGADWRELLRLARLRVKAELEGRALPPAEDVIRAMREERDGQLLGLR